MSNEGKADRRGTVWDWPVGLALGGFILMVLMAGNGATGGALIGFLMVAFGGITWMARRGTFSPRRD